jgi:hypothetical protein
MTNETNPYQPSEQKEPRAASASPWRFAWIVFPSVWTFFFHLPVVDPAYFHGVPLLMRKILPWQIHMLMFFLTQWPITCTFSSVIAAALSGGNKYLALVLISQALWSITPWSWI